MLDDCKTLLGMEGQSGLSLYTYVTTQEQSTYFFTA